MIRLPCGYLARHLFRLRQHRLDLADVDEYESALRGLRVGLDDAGDNVALPAGVLAERLVVLGVAQPLQDHLPRGHRGHEFFDTDGFVASGGA